MMNRIGKCALLVAAAAGISAAATIPRCYGQEFDAPADEAAATEDSWYSSPAPRSEKQSLAREKAIQRGAQRMARLEALRWYGFSNSRPTAATMPFTTMYSPAWQQPGGRPFAWYTTSRPIVIIARPTVYR